MRTKKTKPASPPDLDDFELTFRQEISDETAKLIGYAISEWTRVEQGIEEAIWAFLKLPVEEGRILTARLDARYKMHILRGLAEHNMNRLGISQVKGLLKQAEELYSIRNATAHGIWITRIEDDRPFVMSLREKLPGDATRDRVMSIEMSKENITATISNLVFVRNLLIDLRRYILSRDTLPDTQRKQDP